jgi:hypothetical protein
LRIDRPLVFVDRMNRLSPEIPGRLVTLVDAVVQPLNCGMGGRGPVLFNQVSRQPNGHLAAIPIC